MVKIQSSLKANKKSAVNKPLVTTCLLSTLVTAFVILLSYILLGFAPFGDQALLYKDGQQQMIDLFCWYKDALTGKSSIDYTFTKYLGGSNFAVFSYYLTSPFNLLIVFFSKEQASLFMNILYLLKASFASLTAAYYLYRRFRPASGSGQALTIILATSYALSQYMIAQSSNMMWLDGVYMLPLMLAGIEKLVSDKKSTLFIASSALALCFNWYTGIIDLVFAGFWLLFESVRVAMTQGSKSGLKKFASSLLRFVIASVSAALISAAILLPTLSMLSGRSYGKSGIGMLFDFSFIGFVPNVISNYSFGVVSVKGSVSLFAGTFTLIGIVLLFTSAVKALKEKLLYGVFLVIVVLMFYWQPLVSVFSMLRTVDTFWYRYSYVGSFALIYLAAVFYLGSETRKIKLWIPPCAAVVFSILVFFMTDPKTHTTSEILLAGKLSEILGIKVNYYWLPIIAKIIFPVVISLIFCLTYSLSKKKTANLKAATALLAVIVITELTFGQMILGKVYSTADTPALESYTTKELALLENIDDSSFFRLVQTTYHSSHHSLAASYSEPMAYGFNSVSAFVSAPDENSIAFLDRAGYKSYYDTIPVTVSENLALDSLLSVKYVLLASGDQNNDGLTKLAGTDGFKDLYSNPYAVPAAFVINKTGSYESSSTIPAEYLNDLYSYLSGIEKDIFIPVVPDSESYEQNTYRYSLTAGESYILYANFVTNTETGAVLYVNGEKYTSYSMEMAPSMVRIKTIEGKAEVELVFNEDQTDTAVTDAQFYALDLEALEEATNAIKAKAVSKSDISDGHCVFEVTGAGSGDSLFTSVPYNSGWAVTRNGQKITCDLTGDTFITIPLEEGTNVIEMTYKAPRKTAGILASVAGLVMLAGIVFIENKNRKSQ